MTRLFVYGTLKRGCKNHAHLAGQRFVGEARTVPGYRLHDLGDYPGMVAVPADTAGVTGEIWEVDAATLAHLDAFEGVDEGLYHRATVLLAEGGPSGGEPSRETFTYLYARDLTGRPTLGPTWRE